MEPGQNVMIAHMTTQVEMGMKEWKKTKKPKQAKVRHTVILPDWTLEKWALSSFAFQSV